MEFLEVKNKIVNKILELREKVDRKYFKHVFLIAVELVSVALFVFHLNTRPNLLESIVLPIPNVLSLIPRNSSYEVFGFAPYWKINNLDNVDFSTLTTLAYFGVPLNGDGTLDRSDPGYTAFKSDKATQIFSKAHRYGTRVVLTITQMNNDQIQQLLDNPDAQTEAINEITSEVKNRGIDGVNIDMEYVGNPGDQYRNEFTQFVSSLSNKLHQEIPNSKLTVSVYAASVKDKKLYDIKALSSVSDGIFMMAYDFAVSGSDNAMPTAPLYGYKQGKYWYDVSTAVNDFLTVMPSNKLILGVPWYGYDYAVNSPGVNVATGGGYYYWYKDWISPWYWVWNEAYYQSPAKVQTIASSSTEIQPVKTGWDNLGKVGWTAYKDSNGNWREFFMEDTKSLSDKYNFAKNKNLKGVGIWALGFDSGKSDMWTLLRQEFGGKVADSTVSERVIQ